MTAEIGWLLGERTDVPEGDDWLSPRERAVQASFRFAHRRASWRLGRWTARRACRGRADEIVAAADGAPEAWHAGTVADLTLSLSHSHERALVVVGPTGQRIGCDLERIEPRSPAFVADYLTAGEAAWVRGHHRPALAANLVWSAKESTLKALREGLRYDTRRVVVQVGAEPEGPRWGSLDCAFDGAERFVGWWRVDRGFVLTVAGDGPARLRPLG